MKRTTLLYPFFILFLFFITGCDDKKDEDSYTDLIFPDEREFYQTIYADETKGLFHFEANADWSIEIRQEYPWISVEKTRGGPGRVTLHYNTEINFSGYPRDGYIIIDCGEDTELVFIDQLEYTKEGEYPIPDLSKYHFIKSITGNYKNNTNDIRSSYQFHYNKRYQLYAMTYESDINRIDMAINEEQMYLYINLDEHVDPSGHPEILQDSHYFHAIPSISAFFEKGPDKNGSYSMQLDLIRQNNTLLYAGAANGHSSDGIELSINWFLEYDDDGFLDLIDYAKAYYSEDEYKYLQWRYTFETENQYQTGCRYTGFIYSYEQETEVNKTSRAEYRSGIPNNPDVNLDLNRLLYRDECFGKADEFGNLFYMLGYYGKRSSDLVSKTIDESRYEWIYNYETDEKGLVRKISVTNNQDSTEILYIIEYVTE